SVIIARYARLVRSGMLDVLGQDYIRTARAKGLRERAVLISHALRNTLIPITTVLGLDLSALVGGAVIIETVFVWPGMGQQLVQSVASRDYPVVQATVFVVALLVVVIAFVVDLAYSAIDPRIRLE
ncbi:MAG: ABC transporter permease, partial [Dehalococcoidia bacterium]|nr:ABC transporter permease [Dehalococcoidia bacterium]